MGTSGNDYAELCDLGPSRWSSRGYHPPHSTYHHPTSASTSHIRSNSFEAEDIGGPYGSNYRVGNSTSSLRGRSGLYYSPPGTSYTIVERPHSPHYYYNSAGSAPAKTGNLPSRSYLSSTSNILGTESRAGTSAAISSSRHNGKKRPISPEQVLRLFGTSSSSGSGSGGGYFNNNGTRERGRRSPASSPPSTTHQIYRERVRERSVPNIHELTTRTVTVSRDQQSDGFGICVKGGKDAGVGVYISRIEEGSVAERAGLRPGDTILEVNGTPFTAISHDEALKKCVQILKSSRQISMTVRSPPTLNTSAPLHGFGPPRDVMINPSVESSLPFRQTCSWMDRHGRPASPPMEYGGRRHEKRDRIRRVELVIDPGQSLGLMIRGGVEYGLGIFITGVDKESVADKSGLMIGDEILEVNGQSFLDVTHDEAVSQLKFHKRMSLVVKDVGKVPHSCTSGSVQPEPWDPYSPTGGGSRGRRKCPVSAMVEEKARSLLPRHHYASLSYYIAEYGSRGMTIDAFVAVLLEMLDTHEKHTLVTEIRELVFPEDRIRYDELVYRCDRDMYRDSSMDRHRTINDDLGLPVQDTSVTEADLEVIEATSRSVSEDNRLGMGDYQNRHRPPIPLPYRPLSAGPIMHQNRQRLRMAKDPASRSHDHLAVGVPSQQEGPHKGAPPPQVRIIGNHIDAKNENNMEKNNKDYNCEDSLRMHRVNDMQRSDYEQDSAGYFEGIRSHLGGLTQRVKSWYWGRPLELATKLSRSFDMKDDVNNMMAEKGMRRHQSMQRLPLEPNGSINDQQNHHPEINPNVVPDHRGNLYITVKKTKPILGIAIEGGANTKHPLPRIINIHEHGAAFDAGGLEVGQLILEVDGQKVEGMHHQDVARFIAERFACRDKNDIAFLVVEAKKSNLEPKPTALIFLEA